MIKKFTKCALSILCINGFSAIIYYALFFTEVINVYELEEDYGGNVDIYIILFILSSAFVLMISLIFNFDKNDIIIFAAENVFLGILCSIFNFMWLNINGYSVLIFLRRFAYNFSGDGFGDNIGLKIASILLSLLWSSLLFIIGNTVKCMIKQNIITKDSCI